MAETKNVIKTEQMINVKKKSNHKISFLFKFKFH